MAPSTEKPKPVHYLSLSEMAARFDLAPSTMKDLYRRGYLPPPDATVGRNQGWLPETADAWHAARPGQGARTDLKK